MSKHTPGPWALGERTLTGGEWVDIDAPGHGGIAQVVWRMEDDEKSPALEANAKLIVTAPDLLADLREAAATLRRYEVLHRAKSTADSLAKAEVNAALAARFEATIAKATA